MRKRVVLFACSMGFFSTQSFVYAVGPCTICLTPTTEIDLSCTKGHSIHPGCLEHQVRSYIPKSEQDAQATRDHGLPCCAGQCDQSYALAQIQASMSQGAFEQLSKRIQPQSQETAPQESAEASALSTEGLRLRAIREFKDQILEAFNRNCPNCRSTLDQIEGCNAATCEGCGTKFCNLCLARQSDDSSAHAHARSHSGNYWEQRDAHTGKVPQEGEDYLEYEMIKLKEKYRILSWFEQFFSRIAMERGKSYTYSDRYHWLIAREKLDPIFQSEVPEDIRTEVLHELEPLLKKMKMWPIPVAFDTETWTQRVMSESSLDDRNKIALLQNEFIYLNQEEQKTSSEELKGNLNCRSEIVEGVLQSLHLFLSL